MNHRKISYRCLIIAIVLLAPHLSGQTAHGKKINSPRVLALQREIEKGHRDALEEFWSEMSKAGAPLVEPIAGDSENFLATFLWRAKEQNLYIVVFLFSQSNPLTHLMTYLV